MVAVNPVNYGKAYKLSCAESIAATLFLGGFYKEAENILNRFKWGQSFFEVNKELFDNYKNCSNSKELKKVEYEYIEKEINDKKLRKQHNDLEDLENEFNNDDEYEEQIDFNKIEINALDAFSNNEDK